MHTANTALWPEGEQFTMDVNLPTPHEPFAVRVNYIVPSFNVVLEMLGNKDSQKAYSLFRQFIEGWDLEETLSDQMLIFHLTAFPGAAEVIFQKWAEHMKERLAASQAVFAQGTNSIN